MGDKSSYREEYHREVEESIRHLELARGKAMKICHLTMCIT